jgi:hypothetical protein
LWDYLKLTVFTKSSCFVIYYRPLFSSQLVLQFEISTHKRFRIQILRMQTPNKNLKKSYFILYINLWSIRFPIQHFNLKMLKRPQNQNKGTFNNHINWTIWRLQSRTENFNRAKIFGWTEFNKRLRLQFSHFYSFAWFYWSVKPFMPVFICSLNLPFFYVWYNFAGLIEKNNTDKILFFFY